MKKRVHFFFLLLCCASISRAKDGWKLPQLENLSQLDTIQQQSVQLSHEEILLLEHVTQHAVSACAKRPDVWGPRTANGNFNQIRVRRVPLTSNGESGLLAQGSGVCMCGVVGNCPLWLISEEKQPRVLLQSTGIYGFEFDAQQTADYSDLILGGHDSATVTGLQRFRFDGEKYQRVGCARIDWADRNGYALVPPKISSARCR